MTTGMTGVGRGAGIPCAAGPPPCGEGAPPCGGDDIAACCACPCCGACPCACCGACPCDDCPCCGACPCDLLRLLRRLPVRRLRLLRRLRVPLLPLLRRLRVRLLRRPLVRRDRRVHRVSRPRRHVLLHRGPRHPVRGLLVQIQLRQPERRRLVPAHAPLRSRSGPTVRRSRRRRSRRRRPHHRRGLRHGPHRGQRERARERHVLPREEPLQRLLHLGRVAVPVLRHLRQRLVHRERQRGRDRRIHLRERAVPHREDLHEQRVVVLREERPPPRHPLVHHHAHGPDIDPAVERAIPARLLGRHVIRRPHHHAGLREPEPIFVARREHRLRDPEIEQLRHHEPARLLREEHVLGLQVTVDDPRRVRRRERRKHLDRDLHDGPRLHLPVALDALRERLAAEPLHHDVRAPVLQAPHVVDLANIRVPEVPRDLRLVLEPAHRLPLLRVLRVQHLDGDDAPHRHVLGLVDDPHPPFAEHALDRVFVADRPADQLLARRRWWGLRGRRGARDHGPGSGGRTTRATRRCGRGRDEQAGAGAHADALLVGDSAVRTAAVVHALTFTIDHLRTAGHPKMRDTEERLRDWCHGH